jgi:hypothetical protein
MRPQVKGVMRGAILFAMGGDELFITILSICGTLALWGWWLLAGARMEGSYYRNAELKWGGGTAAVGVGVMLFAILKLWASHDVRDDGRYLIQYWFMGAFLAAMLGQWLTPMLGISWRHDVCENRNPAAAFAWVGAVAGLTLAYAGSNIGDGPGWWVVVFCSFLSCGFLVLLWFLLELVCHISDRVTVERDLGAGMRFGGLMLGMGIVAGRGAAGNWVDSGNAVSDFISVVGPALPLPVAAGVVELALRPRPQATRGEILLFGAIPGVLFLLGGLFYVVLLKPW